MWSRRASWAIGALIALTVSIWAQQPPAARAKPAAGKFRISGTVVDAIDAHLLPRVEVSVGPAEGSGPAQSVTTTDDGGFQFDGLKPGKYWLAGQSRGYARQNLQQHEIYSTAIAVGPDLHSENLVFRLYPEASISGTITDETNEPIRDARIMLFLSTLQNGERATHSHGQTQTNDQGHYHFGHLSPGTYFIAVSAHPWYAQNSTTVTRTSSVEGQAGSDQNAPDKKRSPLDVAYPITFYAGTTDASAAAAITVKAGDQATADVSLTAIPALRLQIRTHPDGGTGATVVEHLFDETIPASMLMSIENDVVEVAGLAPGAAEIRLYGKDQTAWSQTVNLSDNTEITAGEGSPLSTISGVVRVDGVPASVQLFIQLRNKSTGETFGAQVGAKGEFKVQNEMIMPGTYEVSAANIPAAAVRAITASGTKVTGQNIEVGGGAVRLAIDASKELGRVDGIALRNGKPMAGAMIVLVPSRLSGSAPLFRRDQSDSDGTFSLMNIVPGRYTVIALADGWDLEWMDPSVLKPLLKNGEPVEVGGGRQQIKVKVQ